MFSLTFGVHSRERERERERERGIWEACPYKGVHTNMAMDLYE